MGQQKPSVSSHKRLLSLYMRSPQPYGRIWMRPTHEWEDCSGALDVGTQAESAALGIWVSFLVYPMDSLVWFRLEVRQLGRPGPHFTHQHSLRANPKGQRIIPMIVSVSKDSRKEH